MLLPSVKCMGFAIAIFLTFFPMQVIFYMAKLARSQALDSMYCYMKHMKDAWVFKVTLHFPY